MPNILYYIFGFNFDTVVGWSSVWAFLWPGQYPNIPIWFLWCLFLMNVLFWMIFTISNKYCGQWLLILLCVVCGFTGSELLNSYSTDYGNVFKALQANPEIV